MPPQTLIQSGRSGYGCAGHILNGACNVRAAVEGTTFPVDHDIELRRFRRHEDFRRTYPEELPQVIASFKKPISPGAVNGVQLVRLPSRDFNP